MNILQITHQFPYPPDRGGKIGIFNFTKYYTQNNHNVILLSMIHNNESYVDEILNYCAKCYTFPVNSSNSVSVALKSLFTRVPFNIYKYHHSEFLRLIDTVFKENNIDVVHVDHLHVAYCGIYIKKKYKVPVVLREHNLEMEIMQRYSREERSFPKKAFATLQYWKLRRYEPQICERFDYCFCVTERDKDNLKKLNPGVDARYVPAGVNTSLYSFRERVNRLPDVIVSMGAMNWLPNLYGLEWFIKSVFPLLKQKKPSVELWIAGIGDIPKSLGQLIATTDGVKYLGYVKNDIELLQKARVMIIPLFSGGGVRIKALNAFSTGLAVVSTPIGVEGLPVHDGVQCLIAEKSDEFAEKLNLLLENDETYDRVSLAAYDLVKEKYSWESIVSLQLQYLKDLSERSIG